MNKWKPSIDPLAELENHAIQLRHHNDSINNIANAVNQNAVTLHLYENRVDFLLERIEELALALEQLTKEAK